MYYFRAASLSRVFTTEWGMIHRILLAFLPLVFLGMTRAEIVGSNGPWMFLNRPLNSSYPRPIFKHSPYLAIREVQCFRRMRGRSRCLCDGTHIQTAVTVNRNRQDDRYPESGRGSPCSHVKGSGTPFGANNLGLAVGEARGWRPDQPQH